MIRLGIVGSNYGRLVQLPAFRADPRCRVVALAATDASRVERLAREADVPKGYGDWEQLLQDPEIDAVALAVPPDRQPAMAIRALDLGKPVFAEKPLATDLDSARAMMEAAMRSGQPTLVDFEYPCLPIWQRAKSIIDEGGIGRIRHVIVSWAVENQAVARRRWSWKTAGSEGGGVLGNFISHCFNYLEWFAGPIDGLSARLFRLIDADVAVDSMASLALSFASGASGSLTMSCASFCGSGHRIEFYGTDGTLMLLHQGADYMRGFRLLHARRPDATPRQIEVAPDPLDAHFEDGRIAPVARLASRFLDAIENGKPAAPSMQEGLRVQELIDAARRSHTSGCWVATPAREGMSP